MKPIEFNGPSRLRLWWYNHVLRHWHDWRARRTLMQEWVADGKDPKRFPRSGAITPEIVEGVYPPETGKSIYRGFGAILVAPCTLYKPLSQPRNLFRCFRAGQRRKLKLGTCGLMPRSKSGGGTEPGFVLHGGCLRFQPDCNVTLEIRISKSPGRRCAPLARVCWRSLKGGHTNPRRAEMRLSGVRVGATHIHLFDDNWLPDKQRMRGGNLPFAAPIEQELQSFTEFRDYAGKQFRINNITVVQPPEWEYRLDL